MMKTEKRKANVGERILITNPELTGGNYGKGDVLNVVETHINTVVTEDNPRWIRHNEYEVIVAEPKKSARITALETQVAELQAKVEALEKAGKYPLTERFERESTSMDAILADIERKAKPTLEALLATYPSANEKRADVIKRAKAFVAENTIKNGEVVGIAGVEFGWHVCHVEFIVNTEKRAVTLLAKGVNSGKVRAKGIAKCDPDDVFNANIGKAIALARALGVEVPIEFVKAVQPTEVVVGQIVYDNDVENDSIGSGIVTAVKPEGFMNADEGYTLDGGWAYLEFARITDDTDAVYE